ncbi:glycosyltransferase family 4 protein [Egicoccus halophilus]|uniref:Glycosyltransferase subfamily 4-like N-terminal domain-containing protein n=1 Tax=Egicoccus halophilus TaxID=1670830 RepID=A0A8J3ADM3_9ACTN|nr:glycosyltransferase family 4 protein [Egicoccus halophilus]GGI05422.1 hypothetical protein GCM10011354_14020 [Egicoccus halophilus]
MTGARDTVTRSVTDDERRLVLVMWGDLFEDFHDTIGVDLRRFRDELTGGWLFAYVEALARVGVRTTLVHVSARVGTVTRFRHRPTGAAVTILPAPRRHRLLRALGRRFAGRRSLKSLASYGSLPLLALASELRRCRAEAVLTQEYEHARFDVLVALGRLLRVPVYATFQGGVRPRSRLDALVRRRAVRAAAGLMIASADERARVMADYDVPPERIAPVPNALDLAGSPAPDRTAARARLGIPDAARVVLWYGRVTIHRKGLDVLLDAWSRVRGTGPDGETVLLLVGTGPDAAELHRRLAGPAWSSVRWRDEYVADRQELLVYQSAADVFVLPSRHEGFAVAPIEAMALGLPVVAGDAPGIPDLLPDGEASGGLVVPREDPDALARALQRLLDDPQLCRRVGVRARARVEACYGLDVVGRQLRDAIFPPSSRAAPRTPPRRRR